jgi:hypothetical protein
MMQFKYTEHDAMADIHNYIQKNIDEIGVLNKMKLHNVMEYKIGKLSDEDFDSDTHSKEIEGFNKFLEKNKNIWLDAMGNYNDREMYYNPDEIVTVFKDTLNEFIGV